MILPDLNNRVDISCMIFISLLDPAKVVVVNIGCANEIRIMRNATEVALAFFAVHDTACEILALLV